MMPSILALPAELRDQIIDLVILAPTKPHKDAFSDNTPRRPSSTNLNIMYPASAPCEVYSAYGLLLTCRQLHTDTRARISSLNLPAEIDVMVVNRRDLWPTWVSIPSGTCSAIAITFRLGDEISQFSDHLFCHFGIQYGHHVPTDQSTVLDLLQHVLRMCTHSPNADGAAATSSAPSTRLFIGHFDPPPHLHLPMLRLYIPAPEGMFQRGSAPFVARNESADLTAYDNIHLLRCRTHFMNMLKMVNGRWPRLRQQPDSLRKAVAAFILTGFHRGITKIDHDEAVFVLEFKNGARIGRLRVSIDGDEEAGLRELW